MMSVQVYTFRFSLHFLGACSQAVKAFVRHRQRRGTEFESRYLQNLNFLFLNFLEVLGHPGQYIDTF